MKRWIGAAACVAIGVVSIFTAVPARALSSLSRSIYVGDSCGTPLGTRIGHVKMTRTGRIIKLTFIGDLPSGDAYDIELWSDPGCTKVDGTAFFVTPTSGHIHKTVRLHASPRARHFFLDIYDFTAGANNETHPFHLTP